MKKIIVRALGNVQLVTLAKTLMSGENLELDESKLELNQLDELERAKKFGLIRIDDVDEVAVKPVEQKKEVPSKPPEVSVVEKITYTEEFLKELSMKELKKILGGFGISDDGTKSELRERILKAQE